MRYFSQTIVLLLVLQLSACTNLLFYPQPGLDFTPDQVGRTYHDVWFDAADGARLHGWFLPADSQADRGEACTVLFLHGNAGNIGTHLASVWWLPEKSYNVFLFDYRGYGRSAGSPGLRGLHLDTEAALHTVFAMKGVDPDRVVIFGQSLGGSIAITALAHSAYRHRPNALIIEGALSSYRGIVREKLAGFWLTWPLQRPLSLTIEDDYRPLDAIGKISPVAVLVVHGLDDQVVPLNHGEALYAAAAEPKELWLVPAAAHIEAFLTTKYRNRLLEFLASHCEPRLVVNRLPLQDHKANIDQEEIVFAPQ